jgi:4,5-DOPA dioxygenase extradiol
MPLLGRQPDLVHNMKEVVSKYLPQEKPTAIVVISAHWESDPIRITSSQNPKMYYDYGGFPREAYEFKYPAPGSPDLAQRIQTLLGNAGLDSKLDSGRGYDHGVFIPLMIMYPEADIPVVCVSLHGSLEADKNMQLGEALVPLRDDGVLILGSGYTFHNMQYIMNPSQASVQASNDFNGWLKNTLLDNGAKKYLEELTTWDQAPGGRASHPREEHLLPLLVVAAAGGDEAKAQLIYDTTTDATQCTPSDMLSSHAVTGYMFN